MRTFLLNESISDVLPHIFKRPVLTASANDSLLHAGTFLAIGPQIYVDGLVVFKDSKAVGRMGGGHIIQYILQHPHEWMDSRVSEVMSDAPRPVAATETLGTVLEIFKKTRFAFVPVTIDDNPVTAVSIRDMLRVVSSDFDYPIEEISSPLISGSESITLKAALGVMLERWIRNLAVTQENHSMRILNDRKVLEFLLSHEGRKVLAGPDGLDSVHANQLDLLNPKYVNDATSMQMAAGYLSEVGTPCVLLSDKQIITPWDIVIKGVLR